MPEIAIGQTFGAMFVGSLVAMVVYGITTLQTYFYYMHYPRDGYGIKFLVATLWILDTLHIILMSHAMYYYLIIGFGNPHVLLEGTWSLFASLANNVLVAFIVQCFFTQRIYILSPPKYKWWFSAITAISVLAHFCFGIETAVHFFMKKEFVRLKEANFESVLPFAITAILSDILIAVALCLLLDSNRSDFEETNSIINQLIVYAIHRCVLTSTVAIIEVVVFVTVPHSLYSFAFDFIIGKLYANSLLATLNARQSIRRRGNLTTVKETSTSFQLASVVTDRGPRSLVHKLSRDNGDDILPRGLDDAEGGDTMDSRKGERSFPSMIS